MTITEQAREAAEEVANWMNWKKDAHPYAHEQNIETLTRMLTPYVHPTSVTEAIEEVRPYLSHLDECASVEKPRKKCDCGLDEILVSTLQGKAEVNESEGVQRIAAERRRQVEQEGWTPEHDAEHVGNELAQAAACYAWPPMRPHFVKNAWPWDREYWKPEELEVGFTNEQIRQARIKVLVKAGALIAAEIDRLLRAATTPASIEAPPQFRTAEEVLAGRRAAKLCSICIAAGRVYCPPEHSVEAPAGTEGGSNDNNQ